MSRHARKPDVNDFFSAARFKIVKIKRMRKVVASIALGTTVDADNVIRTSSAWEWVGTYPPKKRTTLIFIASRNSDTSEKNNF